MRKNGCGLSSRMECVPNPEMKPDRLLLEALRFDTPQVQHLSRLNAAEWRDLLKTADAEHLTLALRQRCGPALPSAVRARIDDNLAQTAERFTIVRRSYEEIAL